MCSFVSRNDEDHPVILGLGLSSVGGKWLNRPVLAETVLCLSICWSCFPANSTSPASIVSLKYAVSMTYLYMASQLSLAIRAVRYWGLTESSLIRSLSIAVNLLR